MILSIKNGLNFVQMKLPKFNAWVFTALVLLVVLMLDRAQVPESIKFTIMAVGSIAPFMLLSIVAAAYTEATGADTLVSKVFMGRPLRMIALAAIFGGFSPFCSCGVIPLIAALLTMGVPLAPVMAFWLASPIMDPSMFVLTSAFMGFEFAIAKTLAAVSLGMFGGFFTLMFMRAGLFKDPLRAELAAKTCKPSSLNQNSVVQWAFWKSSERIETFKKSSLKTGLFLLKWLVFAFVLESLMLAYIPAEMIANTLGGNGILPIFYATLIGVPAYMNGSAALPIVASLMEQGISPGAGLSFLVAGGVTSIPAAIAVFALVKKQIFALYVAYALVGSVTIGTLYQLYSSL